MKQEKKKKKKKNGKEARVRITVRRHIVPWPVTQ